MQADTDKERVVAMHCGWKIKHDPHTINLLGEKDLECPGWAE